MSGGMRAPVAVETGALIVAILALVLMIAGCDVVVTTAQLPAVREDAILGQWKDLGTPGSPPESSPLLVRFTGGVYRIGSPEDFAKGKDTSFTLARAGRALIAEVQTDACDEFGENGQPCWSLSLVDIRGARMNWYDFDAQRLGRASFTGTLNVAHSLHRRRNSDGSFDNSVLLSADAAALQSFLAGYVKQRGALRLSGRLVRTQ